MDTIYIIFFLSTAVNTEMVTEEKNTKKNITKNFVEMNSSRKRADNTIITYSKIKAKGERFES